MPESIPADPLPHTSRPLTVCIIAGDRNTSHCGVKDYAMRLALELSSDGANVQVYAPSGWNLRSFLQLRQQILDVDPDIIHIQYPSIGFRYSLLPHLLGRMGLATKACATLHEYSCLPLFQRLSLHLFRWTAQAVLFTTPAELSCFESRMGRAGAEHMVVPIGSNVPVAPEQPTRDDTVLYFGQIRPGKGLEAFLELAQTSRKRKTAFRFKVLGACLPKHAAYFEKLRRSAPEWVEWRVGEPLPVVAKCMARALAAYLPFPDGASYRRGSLLAALTNGLPVLSNITNRTPPALAAVLLPAADAEQALLHLCRLQESPRFAEQTGQASRELAREFSWQTIADKHRQLYLKLARKDVDSWPSTLKQTAATDYTPEPSDLTLNR